MQSKKAEGRRQKAEGEGQMGELRSQKVNGVSFRERICLLPSAFCLLPSYFPVSRHRKARPGQSIVLALGVMFLMIFIGALFVTMIARNLNVVERSGNVSEAQQLAEAGLRYA